MTTPIDPAATYPVSDLCRLSGVSSGVIYNAIKLGRLPAATARVGVRKNVTVRGSDFLAWAAARPARKPRKPRVGLQVHLAPDGRLQLLRNQTVLATLSVADAHTVRQILADALEPQPED